jgi:hypothetical protein
MLGTIVFLLKGRMDELTVKQWTMLLSTGISFDVSSGTATHISRNSISWDQIRIDSRIDSHRSDAHSQTFFVSEVLES